MQVRDRIVELRRVPARDLLPNPKNWRRHPDAQQNAMRAMLADIGYADALLARETPDGLLLIDGHLRAETTPDETVPVLILDVDEVEADKLLATLDPLAGMAVTDAEALYALAGDLDIPSAEMMAELERLTGQDGPPQGLTDPDAMPIVAEATSKLGDLWLLGDHRLLCGDATNPRDVTRLLDGSRPLLTVTDPPYGVDYDPNWRNEEAAKGHLADAARRVGEVTNDDRVDWREAWALVPSDVIYVWHADRHASEVQRGIESVGFEIRCQVIWAKPHFPISRGHYHWRHEPCWYAVRKGAQGHWAGARDQTTLWDITLDPNALGGHSTQKPVECMARPMRNHDAPEVYDPFVGSGTSLIAAEMEGRRCYAMDVEPTYCDVAVRRWEDFTGRKAERTS